MESFFMYFVLMYFVTFPEGSFNLACLLIAEFSSSNQVSNYQKHQFGSVFVLSFV